MNHIVVRGFLKVVADRINRKDYCADMLSQSKYEYRYFIFFKKHTFDSTNSKDKLFVRRIWSFGELIKPNIFSISEITPIYMLLVLLFTLYVKFRITLLFQL